MAFNSSQDSHQAFRSIVAERTNPVLAWVGSGLSAPAGLPTWPELHRILCDAFERKIGTLERNEQYNAMALLQRARKETDYWIAFGILAEGLGQTSFKATIRAALAPADKVAIPEAYRSLWGMGISGLLTLNLDRLATRAFNEHLPGEAMTEFPGMRAPAYAHVLKSASAFIGNLHGTTQDASSWVLTHVEMTRLWKSPGYQEFLSACLLSHTVLFIGISADDVAAGGMLSHLNQIGLDLGEHFWVTNRTDAATDKWAEANGIRVIRYDAANDHAELREFFTDLRQYLPTDIDAPPVIPATDLSADDSLPEPAELAALDAETIRQRLNRHAALILAPSSPDSYRKYAEFVRKYDNP